MTREPSLRAFCDDELIIDLFAGGGGASLGVEWALGRSPDVAVNHDPEAIAMHVANHPRTLHLTCDVHDVSPRRVCNGRRVGMLWLSPDCTYHSKARGGAPFRDPKSAKGRRGLAWVAVRWARDVRPRVICLENVEEFQDWGPLLDDGRPDPLRRGLSFRQWKGALEAQGYRVELRELRACDYGAPTIRKRLFVIARCDEQPIVWPVPTHGRGLRPHRAAAECISWELSCQSIFERRKPLAEKTLARIARGVQRFVIDAAEPFVVPVTHHGDARVHGIREPFRTITGAHRGELALVAPSLLRTDMHQSNASCVYPPDEPLRTITTAGGHALIAPTLINTRNGEREGQAPRVRDVREPFPTVTAQGSQGGVVAAFLARHVSERDGGGWAGGTSLEAPAPTVTAHGKNLGVVASSLVKLRGTCRDGQPVTLPMPTITASGNHVAEVRAFLLSYYGGERTAERQRSLFEPLATATTARRHGLVMVHGEPFEIADIGMRMLVPRELFRAQGFPDEYVIDPVVNGKPLTLTAQTRCCGNSVPPHFVAAIVRANLAADVAAEVG